MSEEQPTPLAQEEATPVPAVEPPTDTDAAPEQAAPEAQAEPVQAPTEDATEPVQAQTEEAAEAAAEPSADEPGRAPKSPVGPKILGVAPEPKPLPVVKKKLDLRPPKPAREPLPWPELRDAVASVKDELKTEDIKEMFRLLPLDVRDEVIEGVREFRKGARRPVSAFAAKSLARSVHTARRMKAKAEPSAAVTEALGQAMVAELIAGLEVEQAAEVILPKRDLLERESRNARRRQRDEEEKAKEEYRRQRREAGKEIKQTSFGEFSGPKIKGLEALSGLFGDPEPEAPAETPAAEVPQPATPDVPTAPAEAPTPQAPPEAPEVVPEPAEPDVAPQEPPAPEVDPAPAEEPEPEQPE